MILRIAIGAAIALAVLAGVQTLRLAWAQNAAQTAEQALSDAQDANATCARSVELLRAANQMLADAAKATPQDTDAAIEAVRRERDRLAAELRRERAARAAIYQGDTDAQAWADAAVPAAVADRLRRPADRATGAAGGTGAGDGGPTG